MDKSARHVVDDDVIYEMHTWHWVVVAKGAGAIRCSLALTGQILLKHSLISV